MTLLDAFGVIAVPDHPDPEVVARRREAMVVIYEELMRLQKNLKGRWFEDQDREDVACRVFEAMVSGGPRAAEGFDDERARAYLIRALANGLESLRRSRARRSVPTESIENKPADGPSLEERAELDIAATRIDAARARLFGEIVPAVAAQVRKGNTFFESVLQLRGIEEGRVVLDELIRDEFGANLDPADAKRARNAFDQRFSRVFRRLHDFVDALAVSADEAMDLRVAIDLYKLRQ